MKRQSRVDYHAGVSRSTLLRSPSGRQRQDLMVNRLFEAVEAHATDAAQEDDITIAAIRYGGPQDDTLA